MIDLAILISGRGSNMEAILKSIKKKKIPARPVVVISNKPDAKGLEIAEKLGVATEVVDSQGVKGPSADYDKRILDALKRHGIGRKNGLICLAGYMRILTPEFVSYYEGRIMNIHPSLLPSFPGLRSQKQALEYGVKYSGCTVHFVDSKVDTGPIILQSVVEIKDNDTDDTLAKRILREEHKIYPIAVKIFAENKLKIVGRKTVRISLKAS